MASTAHSESDLPSPVQLDFPYALQYPLYDDADSPPQQVDIARMLRPNLQVLTHDPAALPPPYAPSPTDSVYHTRDMFTPSPTATNSSLQPSPTCTVSGFADGSDEMALASALSAPEYTLPPSASKHRPRSTLSHSASADSLSTRASIAHPYARLYNKKEGTKRRKMWNHTLEKALFTPQEISTMGAPHRRTIYTASLEAHVDSLHAQLLNYALFPVPFEKLDPFRGLNSKTAKSMVAGLHHDAAELKLKLLELERSNRALREKLNSPLNPPSSYMGDSQGAMRRHSIDYAG